MNECKNFDDLIIPLKDFAKQLNKPESTIRTWKRRGELPSFLFKKIGNDIFIKKQKFKEWIENDT